MVEWRRVGNHFPDLCRSIPYEIRRNRYQFLHTQISIPTQTLQNLHILPPAHIHGIVDRHQIPSIIDQRPHLVDDPGALVDQIHHPFRGLGKERRVQKNAVKPVPRPLQPADFRPKIAGQKIRFPYRKPVQGVGCLGYIQELPIAFQMDHPCRPASLSGHSQAPCVGKRIQNRFTSQLVACPLPKIPRIKIKTGVSIETHIDRIPDPIFPHPGIRSRPKQHTPLPFIGARAVPYFEHSCTEPRQVRPEYFLGRLD